MFHLSELERNERLARERLRAEREAKRLEKEEKDRLEEEERVRQAEQEARDEEERLKREIEEAEQAKLNKEALLAKKSKWKVGVEKAEASVEAAEQAKGSGQMLAIMPDGKIVTASGDILLEGSKVLYNESRAINIIDVVAFHKLIGVKS